MVKNKNRALVYQCSVFILVPRLLIMLTTFVYRIQLKNRKNYLRIR
ncbi:hypothetical protein BMQ_pBM50028 (plasmid) [Priestia megaterium QM B1551]|uniref:Uncharacterized protein n=1 Tax=Priestia megaterium (strain ATCC 12872 / QMB1551) TaxID=545693 RepID=D5E3J2_PRIM1|nr:hypothetical protein BMQ_pBM50028 [Priestia megaterium QM B1551]